MEILFAGERERQLRKKLDKSLCFLYSYINVNGFGQKEKNKSDTVQTLDAICLHAHY